MGAVRDTIEDRVAPSGRSPLVKLAEIKEQLFDLLQLKNADLEREGSAAQPRNQQSIDKLKEAIAAVKDAEQALERY